MCANSEKKKKTLTKINDISLSVLVVVGGGCSEGGRGRGPEGLRKEEGQKWRVLRGAGEQKMRGTEGGSMHGGERAQRGRRGWRPEGEAQSKPAHSLQQRSVVIALLVEGGNASLSHSHDHLPGGIS